MIPRITASAVLLAALLAAPSFLPCSGAETDVASALTKIEYKAVYFGRSEGPITKKLNELAAQGWEYVGPLGERLVAFRRRPVVAQRLSIVGKWQLRNAPEKGTVEFTPDGGIRLAGTLEPFASFFDAVDIVIKRKGKAESLSYQIPEEDRFRLAIDYRKLGITVEELRKLFSGPPGGPLRLGFPGSPDTSSAKFTIGGDDLTFTRGEKTVSLKRTPAPQ